VAKPVRDDPEDAVRKTFPLVVRGLFYNGNTDAFVVRRKMEGSRACYASNSERVSKQIWLSNSPSDTNLVNSGNSERMHRKIRLS
jgi:hypothetical protein